MHPDGTEEMIDALPPTPPPTPSSKSRQPVFKLLQCKPKPRADMPPLQLSPLPTPLFITLPGNTVARRSATMHPTSAAFTTRMPCREVVEEADEVADEEDEVGALTRVGSASEKEDWMGVDSAASTGVPELRKRPWPTAFLSNDLSSAAPSEPASGMAAGDGPDSTEGVHALDELASSLEDCQVVSPAKRPALANSRSGNADSQSGGSVPAAPPPSPIAGQVKRRPVFSTKRKAIGDLRLGNGDTEGFHLGGEDVAIESAGFESAFFQMRIDPGETSKRRRQGGHVSHTTTSHNSHTACPRPRRRLTHPIGKRDSPPRVRIHANSHSHSHSNPNPHPHLATTQSPPLISIPTPHLPSFPSLLSAILTPTCISPCFPASPCAPLYLSVSPYVSVCLHVSPCTSLYLHTSPAASPCRSLNAPAAPAEDLIPSPVVGSPCSRRTSPPAASRSPPSVPSTPPPSTRAYHAPSNSVPTPRSTPALGIPTCGWACDGSGSTGSASGSASGPLDASASGVDAGIRSVADRIGGGGTDPQDGSCLRPPAALLNATPLWMRPALNTAHVAPAMGPAMGPMQLPRAVLHGVPSGGGRVA